jgi:hypothetical protein
VHVREICGPNPSFPEIVTPRIFNSETLSKPGKGGGESLNLVLGKVMINSLVLAAFSRRLHGFAQASTLASSEEVDRMAEAGISK